MKATGNFAACQHVDPMVALTDATRAHIDHWTSKFPADRRRSAVIQGLMAAQEQNGGWLTDELMAAVAKYLGIPPVWAYEVATFYSMFDLAPVGRHKVAICTNISCWLNGAEDIVRHCERHGGVMTLEDLTAYRSVWRGVLRGTYRGRDIMEAFPVVGPRLKAVYDRVLAAGRAITTRDVVDVPGVEAPPTLGAEHDDHHRARGPAGIARGSARRPRVTRPP